MKEQGDLPRRTWMLPVAVIGLAAGHGIVLYYVYYVASHAAISTAVASGVIALVVIKHMGLFGPAYALLRRFARRHRR